MGGSISLITHYFPNREALMKGLLDQVLEDRHEIFDELAAIADRNPPVLQARDRMGRDEDWIDYHPAYREMERIAFGEFQFHANAQPSAETR